MAVPQGPYYKALGANIRVERRKKGMTQAQLATTVGLTRTSITNIEMGRQPIYVHVLAKMAHSLRISIDALLPEANALEAGIESRLATLSEHHKEWITSVIAQENP
jgi:transcriptional regulator with XRE-family HTH domain